MFQSVPLGLKTKYFSVKTDIGWMEYQHWLDGISALVGLLCLSRAEPPLTALTWQLEPAPQHYLMSLLSKD